MDYKVKDNLEDQDVLAFLFKKGIFSKDFIKDSLKGFTFYEFTLEELGFPDYKTILDAVLTIKSSVGIKGWTANGLENKFYKGFSLTYNPDFHDTDVSIYHQTWGSKDLTQVFGRARGLGNHTCIKNTYYDTYAFRRVHHVIQNNLNFLFERIKCPILRSRVAFFSINKVLNSNQGWHVDEPPCELLRINIPLQTHQSHVLEIKGYDEFGNTLDLIKHLEVGKAYIWNTRIPHRVTLSKELTLPIERIHMVLGLGPWVNYNATNDSFSKSNLHGIPLQRIVQDKLFIQHENN